MKLYSPSRISRRLGEKFFFKAERDATPKSAMVRRPYPPGMHGNRRSRRGPSGFGTALRERQKVRYLYGVSNTVLKRYAEAAARVTKKTKPEALGELLERRIDNVVYRMGFVLSRRIARAVTSHGHILRNGKRVRVPSILVRSGDTISVHESSRTFQPFENFSTRTKKYQPPEWVRVDAELWSGSVAHMPGEIDPVLANSLAKVVEFYSR